MATVALKGVSKVFGDGTVAVDNVSLDVGDGEFMVLLGPSGCGKSTLLRMIAGLEDPTAGEVMLDGAVANDLAPRERKVAMVFQDFGLYPHMSVKDNIGFPLRIAGLEPVARHERVADIAGALGIGDVLARKPGQLSGGQRQRVAMGRAIVRRPALFLMDEPLSNLDSGLRAELRAEISALVRELGVTTVYVTHDQAEALTMADRVAILRRGVLQDVGTPTQVYSRPGTLYVAAFLGSPRMNLLEASVYVHLDRYIALHLERAEHEVDRYEHGPPVSWFHDHYEYDLAMRPDGEGAELKRGLMRAVLAEARRFVAERGGRILFLVEPAAQDMTRDLPIGPKELAAASPAYRPRASEEFVTGVLKDLGADAVSLWDPFERAGADGLFIVGDGHWNKAGMDLAARETDRHVRERWPELFGPSTAAR